MIANSPRLKGVLDKMISPRKRKSRRRRRVKAASLVEAAVALIVFIPVLLVFSDLIMLVFNVQLNDSVCQDAARVAALGDPSTAEARAQAIVSRANARGDRNISLFKLLKVSQTDQPSTAQGGPIEGSVTVETAVEFTPQIFKLIGAGQTTKQVVSRQTYPFTYVSPAK